MSHGRKDIDAINEHMYGESSPEQPIHRQNCSVFQDEPCNCGLEWKVPRDVIASTIWEKIHECTLEIDTYCFAERLLKAGERQMQVPNEQA